MYAEQACTSRKQHSRQGTHGNQILNHKTLPAPLLISKQGDASSSRNRRIRRFSLSLYHYFTVLLGPPLQEESLEREKRHTHVKSADAHTNITTRGDRTPRGGVLHGNVTRAHAQAYAHRHTWIHVCINMQTHMGTRTCIHPLSWAEFTIKRAQTAAFDHLFHKYYNIP